MATANDLRPNGNVLVATAEDDMRLLLMFNLRVAGFQVIVATDGPSTAAIAARSRADVVVLDSATLEPSGVETCRRVRESVPDVAIMVIAGRALEDDPVAVYGAGADDYLSHPFMVSQLVDHVSALVRCTIERRLARGLASEGTRLRWRGLEVDCDTLEVWVDGVPAPLRPIEARLLVLFLENPARVFTRGQILEVLWGRSEGNRHAVDTQLRGLREKLGRYGDAIAGVHGIGYRLRTPDAEVIDLRRGLPR